MHVTPYLFFDGRCEEALRFYEETVGAKVDALMRFKDAPDQSQVSPENKEKVMHSAFHVGETEVFASDGFCTGQSEFRGFSLALTAKDDEEAERLFANLQEGGEVRAPIAETFFASRFGIVADKFGVAWMVLTES
ncbi:VOC family protein [Methyloligella solikamskensis]|uniref:VOC family protein n=1 Tax=Methyloligella solikamskensis TaxID=1177756 RepID=A0ABW3JD42_9HYPH